MLQSRAEPHSNDAPGGPTGLSLSRVPQNDRSAIASPENGNFAFVFLLIVFGLVSAVALRVFRNIRNKQRLEECRLAEERRRLAEQHRLVVKYGEDIADIRNLLLETTQSANTQLNDHMRALADKTSEQIVKLDVALENELSKSISSLGRQLTALSKQFVEDYSPLTERLRAIVQTGRGA
jgi:hypothetical protein